MRETYQELLAGTELDGLVWSDDGSSDGFVHYNLLTGDAGACVCVGGGGGGKVRRD